MVQDTQDDDAAGQADNIPHVDISALKAELEETTAHNERHKLPLYLAIALIFMMTAFAIVIGVFVPTDEAVSFVKTPPTSQAVMLQRSGKVTKLAHTNDNQPAANWRPFPRTYICLNECDVRFVLPRWLSLFVSDDMLSTAKLVKVEYSGTPRVMTDSTSRIVTYQAVDSLSVDDVMYMSAGTSQVIDLTFLTMFVLSYTGLIWFAWASRRKRI